MAAKMLSLFALIALCASLTTATHVPWHLPLVTPLGAMNPCMQYCMMQQPFAMGSFASPASMLLQHPCMQYCMMQQPFAMGSFASPASMLLQHPCMQYCMMQLPIAMGSFASPASMMLQHPCMQYCMMQQPFAMGSLTSPASLIMQQPWALPLQQNWSPMMTLSMLSMAQCPFMSSLMARAISPMFFQQPFVGVPF